MSSNVAAPEGYAPIGPADPPRLVRQRHVRRGWVGIGVLAIVLAALGSATLFRAIGPSQEYLALSRDVPVGAQLTSDDLRVVRLSSSPGLSPVPFSDVREVVGAYAAVPLTAGTLLSMDQLTDEVVPGPGQQLLAVEVPRDRLPGRELQAGDPVELVATRGQVDLEDVRVVTFEAEVHAVQEADGRGDGLVVSLLVAEREGAVIAALAAEDELAVVRVAEAGS